MLQGESCTGCVTGSQALGPPGKPAWWEGGGSALGGAPQEGALQQGGRRAPEGGQGLRTRWKLCPVLGSVLNPFSLPEP